MKAVSAAISSFRRPVVIDRKTYLLRAIPTMSGVENPDLSTTL
jgi:hypothetical protein